MKNGWRRQKMFQDRLISEIHNILRKIERNKSMKISTADLEKRLKQKITKAEAKGIKIKG